jgi:chromosome segregation ATPase
VWARERVLYIGQLKVVAQVEADCQAQLAQKEQETNNRLARYTKIVNAEEFVGKLKGQAQQWKQHIGAQQKDWEARLSALQQSAAELEAAIRGRQAQVAALEAELSSVEEALDMQSFGFYEPRYNLGSSHQYKARLDACIEKQKRMVKDGDACRHTKEWMVEGSAAKGKQMMREKEKMMLLAFNGEADAMIAKVKYNNVETYEKRLRKGFEAINKLGKANEASLSPHYLDLKIEELHLVYEHAAKVQEEKEEQRRIKEEMKEEARVEAELLKVIEDASREESKDSAALARARAELNVAIGVNQEQAEKLQSLVAGLEARLREALDRKAKAIARAQLTKSGHTYVLSNIGAFGESVFKIGMTRRHAGEGTWRCVGSLPLRCSCNDLQRERTGSGECIA